MATSGEAAAATGEADAEVEDLTKKFSAFCDTRTKDQFTSKACNKLVKDCFEEHYKFKNVILTNRVDSSVFSKCKEKSKPYMVVNADNCEKFLQGTALQFARIKAGNEKLPSDDSSVTKIYSDLKGYVVKSSGPKIKTVKQSATGNVKGLTDTTKYTGSHKLRFDETGKGRGKAGRVDEPKNAGYVANYKGEGTFDKKEDDQDSK